MRQAPAQASTQKTHTTIFSFSLPQTSLPLFPTSQRVPQKVEAARITICCDAVYVGTVPKHKCATCGNLLRFESSFAWSQSVYGIAPSMLPCRALGCQL